MNDWMNKLRLNIEANSPNWLHFMFCKVWKIVWERCCCVVVDRTFVCRLRRLSDRFLLELDRRKRIHVAHERPPLNVSNFWCWGCCQKRTVATRCLGGGRFRAYARRGNWWKLVAKVEAEGQAEKIPTLKRHAFRFRQVCTLRFRQVTKSQQFNWISRMSECVVLFWFYFEPFCVKLSPSHGAYGIP